jgi:hypothetical protein
VGGFALSQRKIETPYVKDYDAFKGEGPTRWAQKRNCRLLKADTQNINVPACRLYSKLGCVLGVINRYAYVDFPDEVELVWYKEL